MFIAASAFLKIYFFNFDRFPNISSELTKKINLSRERQCVHFWHSRENSFDHSETSSKLGPFGQNGHFDFQKLPKLKKIRKFQNYLKKFHVSQKEICSDFRNFAIFEISNDHSS